MVFVDTDLLVAMLRGDRQADQKLDALESSRTRIRASTITAMELFFGAYLHAKTKEKIDEVSNVLDQIELADFDLHVSDCCGKLLHTIRTRKIDVDLPDVQIAATVIAHNDTIITRNIKDFSRIPGLRVETW